MASTMGSGTLACRSSISPLGETLNWEALALILSKTKSRAILARIIVITLWFVMISCACTGRRKRTKQTSRQSDFR